MAGLAAQVGGTQVVAGEVGVREAGWFSLNEPLSELNVWRDWDYFTSHFESLRMYLADGILPRWNFHFCAGTPELANPQSYAFAWPSVFAYALPPIWAVLFLMISMTVVGWLSFYHLMRLFEVRKRPAVLAASVWALSGYFASHFNQGHMSFFFMHFIPLLIWMAEKCLRAPPQKQWRWLGAQAVVAAAFFSAGLPHGLFYAYPILFLYALARRTGVGRIALAHGIGFLLAGYKLVPVVAWQLQSPRVYGVPEQVPPLQILQNLVTFIGTYHPSRRDHFPTQYWGYWEYHAYVGYLPLLLLGIGLIAIGVRLFRTRRLQVPSCAAALSVLSLCCGLLLATGNDYVFSPYFYLQHLPLFSGVRVFGRYSIIFLFGLTIASGLIWNWLEASLESRVRPRVVRLAGIGVLLSALIPLLVQVEALVSSIRAIPMTDAAEALGLKNNQDGLPKFAAQFDLRVGGYTFENTLLRRGYWVSDCYEPLRVLRTTARGGITEPEPISVALDSNTLTLTYDASARAQPLVLNFPKNPALGFSESFVLHPNGRWAFPAPRRDPDRLQISVDQPIQWWGLATSLLGLVLFGALWRWCKRRGRSILQSQV